MKPSFCSGSRVEVLLPRPFDHGFDYRVPEGMTLAVGDVVVVPLGRQTVLGVVWGQGTQTIEMAKCKSILRHLEMWPAFTAAHCQFIRRVAEYVMVPLGLVLKMALPNPHHWQRPLQQHHYELMVPEITIKGSARKAVAAHLREQPAERSALMAATGAASSVLAAMVKAGQLRTYEKISPALRAPVQLAPAPALTTEQQVAAAEVRSRLGAGFSVSVLDGVTGSGKTEVYFDAIEPLLRQSDGAQTLVLLPEIALTTQWLARCEARFGAAACVWHSGLSDAQRRRNLHAIISGAARLVVGARSALFLPLPHLALIVVDEEHEPSYKQEEGVCYQARDMAVLRGHCEGVPVLLASATPSLETVVNIEQGKYHRIALPSRYGTHDVPAIGLIDMRQHKPERGSWIAPPLLAAMVETLAAGQQAMLFLNRRGYAPLMLCRACGHRFQCPNCTAWMVQHLRPNRLQCHHCDTRLPLPDQCPACHAEADQLVACGPGVERLAEEVAERFPEARCVTLTSDEPDLPSRIESIINHEVDIIVGTQLMAKGHHFPQLALVGVVDADLGLMGGDLRACERTYQLLHQLAGRAGRAAAKGQVWLQTYQPEHGVMQALAAADRDGFMEQEKYQRVQGGWPPFGRLAALVIDGEDETTVARAARAIAAAVPRMSGVQVLGPAPAPLARLKRQFRYRLLVKAPRDHSIQALLRGWLSGVSLPASVRLKVDVDPYSFL